MLVIIEAIVTVFVAVLLTAFVVWFFFGRNQSESISRKLSISSTLNQIFRILVKTLKLWIRWLL